MYRKIELFGDCMGGCTQEGKSQRLDNVGNIASIKLAALRKFAICVTSLTLSCKIISILSRAICDAACRCQLTSSLILPPPSTPPCCLKRRPRSSSASRMPLSRTEFISPDKKLAMAMAAMSDSAGLVLKGFHRRNSGYICSCVVLRLHTDAHLLYQLLSGVRIL